MQIKRLDRIVVLVRDFEKALGILTEKFGMRFQVLDAAISKRDGVKSAVCHATHVHLISPILPLLPSAPPPMVKRVEMLKQQEAVIIAITFKVDDVTATAAELEQGGIRIQKHRYARSRDYASIGMDNFEEIMCEDADTFGIVVGFSNYIDAAPPPPPASPVPVHDLDRLIVGVRDMDKALAFFRNRLGLSFRETDKRVQQEAGNRGLVCLDGRIHLVQPSCPLPPTVPPPMKMASVLLETREAIMMLLVFKVRDARSAAARAKAAGLSVIRSWEDERDYASAGIDHLYEYLFDSQGTFGLPICISTWTRS